MRTAILLAAGRSRRFGLTNKLLAPGPGGPLLARSIRLARAAPVGRLIVVTGHQGNRVATAARRIDRRLSIVHARRHAQGMGASLAAGAAALWPIEREVLIFLGDMGWGDPRLARRLLATPAGVLAARPVVRGRPGHPVLLRGPMIDRARGLAGDAGLGRLIAALGPTERRALGADRRCLADADRPTALHRRWPALR